uniref:Uncharacterized protein n=1 Tax=Lotharella globosa TaxID=91324 RepID=A0A7S3YWX3_9EUKA
MACFNKDPQILRIILQSKVDVNSRSDDGDSLLHLAAQQKLHQNAQTLIEFSADIAITDASGKTPLHVAAASGDTKMFSILLKPTFDTMQFFDLICGQRSEIRRDPQVLLEIDAKIERKKAYGYKEEEEEDTSKDKKKEKKKDDKEEDLGSLRTALHIAAMHGHVNFVKSLCAARCNVNVTDKNQRTALHLACLQGKHEAAKGLLDGGADVHAIDKNGMTPVILAAAMGRLECVREIVANRTTPQWWLVANRRDSKGMTALTHAAKQRNHQMVALLLKHKADPNAKDLGHVSPLHMSILTQSPKVAKAILASKQPFKFSDALYWYHVIEPLGARHFVKPSFSEPKMPRQGTTYGNFVRANKLEKGWIQIDNGLWLPTTTNPDAKPDQIPRADPIVAPFMHPPKASTKKQQQQQQQPNGDSKSPKSSIVGEGEGGERGKEANEDANEEANEDANEYDDALFGGTDTPAISETLASFPEISGDASITEKTGILSVELETKDILGRTALHVAAMMGELGIASALIESKANLDPRDKDGLTPLYLAANEGRFPLVQLLLNRKADYRIPRNDGWTPLHVACAFERLDIVKALLKANANPVARDKYGSIPMQVIEGTTDNPTSKAIGLALEREMQRYA